MLPEKASKPKKLKTLKTPVEPAKSENGSEPYDPLSDFPEEYEKKPATPPMGSKPAPIEDGTHIPHWRCLYRDGTLYDEKKVEDILNLAAEEKNMIRAMKGTMGGNEVNVVVFKYDLSKRVIVITILKQAGEDIELLSAYPVISSTHKRKLLMGEIKQWSSGLEAQVMFEHNKKALGFHAVDYFQAREEYLKKKEQEIVLSGFVYWFENIENEDAMKSKTSGSAFADIIMPLKEELELNGLLPNERVAIDEIYFQAEVTAVEEMAYRGGKGHVITIGTSSLGELDFFIGDLGKEAPKKGDIISARAWLHGYLPTASWSAVPGNKHTKN